MVGEVFLSSISLPTVVSSLYAGMITEIDVSGKPDLLLTAALVVCTLFIMRW